MSRCRRRRSSKSPRARSSMAERNAAIAARQAPDPIACCERRAPGAPTKPGGIVMATVLDRPTDGRNDEVQPADRAGTPPRGPRRHRTPSVSRARWLAVLVLGFVVGAALVLLTDSDPSGPSVVSTPAGGGGGGSTAASDSSAASAGGAGATDVNGQHVHGVKAQDIAAEAQPDVPLDAPTRALVAQQ